MTLCVYVFSVCQPVVVTEQQVVVTEQQVKPEVVVIKKERLEEELTGCSVLDRQTAPNSSSMYERQKHLT